MGTQILIKSADMLKAGWKQKITTAVVYGDDSMGIEDREYNRYTWYKKSLSASIASYSPNGLCVDACNEELLTSVGLLELPHKYI